MIGLRELAIVAVVVVVLYGRSGVLKSRQFQTIWPWIAPMRRTSPGQRAPRRSGRFAFDPIARQMDVDPKQVPEAARRRPFLLQGNRLFWFLTILAATAVAAWIVTRTLIVTGAGSGNFH